MKYYYADSERIVEGHCMNDLDDAVQRQAEIEGLIRIDRNEYEILRILRSYGFENVKQVAEKWHLDGR